MCVDNDCEYIWTAIQATFRAFQLLDEINGYVCNLFGCKIG